MNVKALISQLSRFISLFAGESSSTSDSDVNGSIESQHEDQNQILDFDVSLWVESSTRPAGYRQTLKIGDAKYGFCWIPAGEFAMGSPESEEGRYDNLIFRRGNDDEVLHHVKLTRGFWALETPTTQVLYKEVMNANPSYFKTSPYYNPDDLPVENVSYDDAIKFCEALTRRLPKGIKASLPTEAQWEYACRAGTKTAYWYGDSEDLRMMNYGRACYGTTPVKNYDANPWGLFDMHGNVWEMTQSWLGEYPVGTAIDPVGPASGSYRIFRGGCWIIHAECCRSAFRGSDKPDLRDRCLGFRFLLICD